jgi:steroid delta-isomerase-like uncharacterized protein
MSQASLSRDEFDLTDFTERFHLAWNEHDVDGLVGLLTDDIIWVDPSRPTPLHGSAAVREFLFESLRAFPDLHYENETDPPHLITDKDKVSWTWIMEGTMLGDLNPPGYAPTGQHFRVEGVDVWGLRDGKIGHYRTFYDPTEVARQLGLLPASGSRTERNLVALQRLGSRLRRK